MINLRILVPDATRNYVENPSFRYATTGWNATGSTLTRTLTQSRFGIASGMVVTNGSSVNEGVYYRVNTLSGISEPITASVYVRGSGKVRLRLIDNPSGKQYVSDQDEHNLNPNRWTRLTVSGFSTGSNDMRLYVETAEKTARAITFYVDGAQMERHPYATTYCDGEQEGCRWNITAHSSISSRTANTREGGRWVDLAGPCRHNNDLYVTVLGGLGMPPITQQYQAWANAPGSFFQNEKIQNRVITLNFFAKQEAFRTGGTAPTLSGLHSLRQQLIDILKPDKTLNSEAFLFEYSDTDGNKPLYIRMRYEAGLEGEWDIRNRWYNSFPVRMMAVDPLWSEDTQDVSVLGIKTIYNPATPMEIFGKINGEWKPIVNQSGITLQLPVLCSAIGYDGAIYLGGQFTNNGFTRIVKWDGLNFTVLGTGGADGIVRGIAVGPDNTVYATGSFTTIGGVAANYVAKYNPATNTWSAMGTGFNNDGYSICVAQNGQIYAGGFFTTAGGITAGYIARWDGLQWRTVGAASGMNDVVRSIVKGVDEKTLYIGGSFTGSFGSAYAYYRIASVDITTNLISTVGDGFNSIVSAIAVGKDGSVYAGGSFSRNHANTYDLKAVARWNGGNMWTQLGDGLTLDNGGVGSVKTLAIGNSGELYAGGTMTRTGNKRIANCSKWEGNNWNPVEYYNLSSFIGDIYTITVTKDGDLYFGQDTSSGSPNVYQMPKLNAVVNNGTASCWPVLYISGQGTVRYIANVKTGQEIFLDLTVFSGEDVFINFAEGTITSSTRGNLILSVLPGSDLRSIVLLPGDNVISLLITDDVGASAQLRWELADWSVDAVMDVSAL